MSRIGRIPVNKPTNVTVTVHDNKVEVKGPKGTLFKTIPEGITVELSGNEVKVSRKNDEKKYKALHGLMRMLINNMIVGVTDGFKKHLVIEGVGYKAALGNKNKKLTFSLGFSHPVEYDAPPGIEFELIQNNEVIVKGSDKELVGQVAVTIRGFKKPEPYKGKGIRYFNEHIRRKAGKAAASGGAKK